MKNKIDKKGEVPDWLVALLIAIVALVLILYLYLSWRTRSGEGVSFIKDIIGGI